MDSEPFLRLKPGSSSAFMDSNVSYQSILVLWIVFFIATRSSVAYVTIPAF